MTKAKLRKEYKQIRHAVTDRENKENIIENFLFNSTFYKNAESIFIYASNGDEVSTEAISGKAEADKKRTAFPVCVDKNGKMEFYFSKYFELKDGMYGIKEPDVHISMKAVPDTNTLCIVPGVSFDKAGHRIGYGKGYYDRFLSSFTGTSVGLCFEECLCEKIPTDEFDVNVDYIITDKNIYTVK